MQKWPNIWHITDNMGVYMTLLEGADRALLVDTGYGLENVAQKVRNCTDKPLTVLLTHAHHDHVLGARWFEQVYLAQADHESYAFYTSPSKRRDVAKQAQAKGLLVPQDYVTAEYPQPVSLEEGEINLGGLTVQILSCPGHTPGSCVAYVPQYRLLLTADDWNPCTWLFFPEALSAQTLRTNLQKLLELPFEHVLCSHRGDIYSRSDLEAFVAGIGDEQLRAAHPVDMGRDTDTREVFPADGQNFVFDFAKTSLTERKQDHEDG